MKTYFAPTPDPQSDDELLINVELVSKWLIQFLQVECIQNRGKTKAILGLSGGVDSAVSTYLCVKAFGAENVFVVRMPYKLSSNESLTHAHLVVDQLGVQETTIDISAMVDGYVSGLTDCSPARIGNVCARCRMTILYDLSVAFGALPIGTSNKTERLFGYFTWHADDAPAINPLGDLYKTQVWQLARYLGVPEVIVSKPPTADLVSGQTDEGDFGISYSHADRILLHLINGAGREALLRWGFAERDVFLVEKKIAASHFKRHMPTVAMLTDSSINDYYLRPLDY